MKNNNFLHTTKNYITTCSLITICAFGFIEPAYGDWFKVADIKTNLITPVYGLAKDNLGTVAFAVGFASTFLARGRDMWEKGIAFGAGSIVTAGGVKVAETVMNLGAVAA